MAYSKVPHDPFIYFNLMKPFVKWAGGKSKLIDQLFPLFPEATHYYEPFLGGGAIGIYLLEKDTYQHYYFNDLNPYLIKTYIAIKDDVHNLMQSLDDITFHYNSLSKEHKEACFYRVRSLFNTKPDPTMFIFLNKTCFNGLYRVNRKGEFNVPWNKSTKDITLYDENNLLSLSRSFSKVEFSNRSAFQVAMKDNSFVYLDPPYELTFKGYTVKQQDLLHNLTLYLRYLDDRGVKFMLSNSYNDITKEAFSLYNITEVIAPRAISCKGTDRKPVKEVVVTNY